MLTRKPCVRVKAQLPREAVTTNRVIKAMKNGWHTREEIRRATKRSMDEVVDTLARLWDNQEVRIVRVDEEKEFHLAA